MKNDLSTKSLVKIGVTLAVVSASALGLLLVSYYPPPNGGKEIKDICETALTISACAFGWFAWDLFD